jgi:quinolinate synthase
LCYETPSSTEWGNSFENNHPNSFVNIEKFLDKKIMATENYSNEIKPFPHPRSKEAIMNRAMFWGSTVGIHYAEAFYLIRKIIS